MSPAISESMWNLAKSPVELAGGDAIMKEERQRKTGHARRFGGKIGI
jgi:hypothetical protein